MPAPPLAHLGHWYVSLPIFMGPVLLIAIALKIQTWRERKHGPDKLDKRSTVVLTRNHDQTATITLTGPLDYPALIELEAELARAATDTPTIALDLRALTRADQEAAWNLCDTIGRTHATSNIHILLAGSAPATETLARTLAGEGFPLSYAPLHADPSTPTVSQSQPTIGP